MIKIYPGLEETENFEVNLNKICRSFEFKSFISAKHKLCPNGLTVSCYRTEDGKLAFYPEIKYYGYDHFCNNGTAYSDMGDYMIGPLVDEDMKATVMEYLCANVPEIAEILMNWEDNAK